MMLSWIRNNKLKFLIIDSILLIGNVSVLKLVRTDFFIDSDLVAGFIAACIFCGMIFLITIIWIQVTKKYRFLFIQINKLDVIGERILFYGMIFFLLLNFVFVFLMWINENIWRENIGFYFAMPWLIIIFANAYNSINNNKVARGGTLK